MHDVSPPSQPPPSSAEAVDCLQRILASQTLARRPRLRELLNFIGEAYLHNRPELVKEHQIGISVFGRLPGYNSNDDTIVRASVRQLREKIEEYYRGEGSTDPYILTIPRGAYFPILSSRPTASRSKPPSRPLLPILGGAVVFSIIALAYFFSPQPRPTLLDALQPSTGQRIIIVPADAVVQTHKIVLGKAPTLSEYQSDAYINSFRSERTWDALKRQQLLPSSNLQLLLQLSHSLRNANLVVRHPRELTTRDFSDANLILLSGPFANPWVQLLEPNLNFRIDQDTTSAAFIRNLRPLPGEPSAFRPHIVGEARFNYARLAYLPSPTGKGRVLTIGGPSSIVMDRLGLLAADPNLLAQLTPHLGKPLPNPLPSFELLMEAKEIGQSPVETRIVAVRRLTPESF